MNLHKVLVFATTISLFGYVLSDFNCTTGQLTDSQGNCTAENVTSTVKLTTTTEVTITEIPATTDTASTSTGSTTLGDESLIIRNLFKPYSVLPAKTFLPDYIGFEDDEVDMVDEMIQFIKCPLGIIAKNGSCIINNTIMNIIDVPDNNCPNGLVNAITGDCIDEWARSDSTDNSQDQTTTERTSNDTLKVWNSTAD